MPPSSPSAGRGGRLGGVGGSTAPAGASRPLTGGAGLARRCRRASGAGSPEGTCPQGEGAGAGSRGTPGRTWRRRVRRRARCVRDRRAGRIGPIPASPGGPARLPRSGRDRRLPSHERAPQGGRRRIRVSVLPASTPPPPPPSRRASRARRLPSHERAPQGGRRRIRVSLLPASTPPPPPSRRASPCPAASFIRARPARGTTTDKGFCPPRLHASSSPVTTCFPCPAASPTAASRPLTGGAGLGLARRCRRASGAGSPEGTWCGRRPARRDGGGRCGRESRCALPGNDGVWRRRGARKRSALFRT